MAEAVTKDGRLLSDWQQPVNRWAELPNSIHNDEVATKIGMRGGAIPGTVHLNHFVPLIREIWGRRWYETGAISMFYTFATTHKEDVRAVMGTPGADDNVMVEGWVETPEGKTVCKGTLSVGDPGKPDYVASLPLEHAAEDDLRILADGGSPEASKSARAFSNSSKRRCARTTSGCSAEYLCFRVARRVR